MIFPGNSGVDATPFFAKTERNLRLGDEKAAPFEGCLTRF